MKIRFSCLFVLLFGMTAAFSGEVGKKSGRWLEPSIVSLDVTRKQYDYSQPWSRRSQSVTKSGIVIGPREILTTADDFTDRTLVRIQKGGRGQWWSAEVKRVDYPANVAIITTDNEKFWADLKPVALASSVSKDGDIQILRWRGGNLENRKAEFNRFGVGHGNMSDAVHVQL